MRAHDHATRRDNLAAWLAGWREGLRAVAIPLAAIGLWGAGAIGLALDLIPVAWTVAVHLASICAMALYCALIARSIAVRFVEQRRARQDWQARGGRVIDGEPGGNLEARVRLLAAKVTALEADRDAQRIAWQTWHELHPEDRPSGRRRRGIHSALSGGLPVDLAAVRQRDVSPDVGQSLGG